jgi:hypothetical protein
MCIGQAEEGYVAQRRVMVASIFGWREPEMVRRGATEFDICFSDGIADAGGAPRIRMEAL